MASAGNGDLAQGRSISRPPLFKGSNFAFWKNYMQIFIRDQDMELWDIIKKGPYVPMTTNHNHQNSYSIYQEHSSINLMHPSWIM